MSEVSELKEELAELKGRLKHIVDGNGEPGHKDFQRTLYGDKHGGAEGVVMVVRQHETRLTDLEEYRRRERAWRRGIAIGLLFPISDALISHLPNIIEFLSW